MTQCANNLRQIGVGLHNYYDVNKAFPVGCIGCVDSSNRNLAWSTFLLPFIEQAAAWELYNQSAVYYSAANSPATSTIIPVYLCPSTVTFSRVRSGNTTGDVNGNGRYDPGDNMGMIDYGGMFGSAVSTEGNGVMIYDESVHLRQITDGASRTIVAGEDSGRGTTMDGEWADGQNIFDVGLPVNTLQNNELWSDHPQGCRYYFATARPNC